MSAPLLSWWYLPAGFSVKQLSELCQALSDAADKLPNLRHLSMGMELDALLSSNGGAGLSALAGCTQLTSLSLAQYQVSTAELGATSDGAWQHGQQGTGMGLLRLCLRYCLVQMEAGFEAWRELCGLCSSTLGDRTLVD